MVRCSAAITGLNGFRIDQAASNWLGFQSMAIHADENKNNSQPRETECPYHIAQGKQAHIAHGKKAAVPVDDDMLIAITERLDPLVAAAICQASRKATLEARSCTSIAELKYGVR